MGKMIKFEHVNAHGDFEKLLGHLGLDYSRKGTQLRLLCPFHEDTNPSCSITLEATSEAKANTFYCFGCHAKGSIIDFAARYQEIPLRDAAELVAELSGCGLAPAKTSKKARRRPESASKPDTDPKPRKTAPPAENSPEAASEPSGEQSEGNPPLKFTLPLDPEHPYVQERLGPGLALAFGVGVVPEASKSMMKGRCCVPIMNPSGALVAYAGRYLGDDPEEPKWKFPPKFLKRFELFNAHRVVGAGTVVIVEGFFDAMRLHGLGVPAVALMGTAVTEEQVALLRTLGVTRAGLLFDGDAEAEAAIPAAVSSLSRSLFVRVGSLPVGEDPASVEEAILKDTLRELLLL